MVVEINVDEEWETTHPLSPWGGGATCLPIGTILTICVVYRDWVIVSAKGSKRYVLDRRALGEGARRIWPLTDGEFWTIHAHEIPETWVFRLRDFARPDWSQVQVRVGPAGNAMFLGEVPVRAMPELGDLLGQLYARSRRNYDAMLDEIGDDGEKTSNLPKMHKFVLQSRGTKCGQCGLDSGDRRVHHTIVGLTTGHAFHGTSEWCATCGIGRINHA